MTFTQILLILIIAIPITLNLFDRLRVDTAALIIAVSLGIAQVAGLGMLGAPGHPEAAKNAISGFAEPAVLTLIALFGITRGLDKTGVTRWIATRLTRLGGTSERRLIVLFTSTAAFLSLFMNNLAAGALLLPSALDTARRTGVRPSKLLIPVAYGTLLGGAATYFTTANIIVSGLLPVVNPTLKPLGIFDFTPTGGVMALAGIAFMAIFGPRLLPNRTSSTNILPRPTGTDLQSAYELQERLWEARVTPESPIVGETLAQAAIGAHLGISIIAIWHGRQAILSPTPDQIVHADDILLLAGREDRVTQLSGQGLAIGRDVSTSSISARGVSLLEVMPAPHASVLGKTLKQVEFRHAYGLTAVALSRDGHSYRTDVADFAMKLGDTFLLVGTSDRLRQLKASGDYIVLEPDLSDRPIDRRKLTLAIGVTAGAVIASVLGVSTFLAMLIAVLILILTNIITIDELYRSVEWQAIFLVGGMYSISTAMTATGLAALVGQGINSFVTTPLGLAAASYWLTALLTQVIGGQVVALATGPIAISAAYTMHPGSQLPQAVAMVTAIACAASFLTPIAHPVNILMIGPGSYKFSDFFRVGVGLTIVCFIAMMLALPIFWRL